MFQERNQELLNSNNNNNNGESINNKMENNEYFFDRNGKAFHHVMEWYRNGGEMIWHNHNDKLTIMVEEEIGRKKNVEDEYGKGEELMATGA